MLKIKGLTISYGDNLVIDDIDLEFGIGTTCLIGESGCGKSSILNALVHQINFKADSYSLDEVNLKEDNQSFFREKVAYLSQNNNFISDLSCFDNMRLFASYHDITLTDEDIKKYLNVVGLDHVTKKSYPDNLSGGEKQRLAIAQALAKQSDIILCDEITAALDYETKLEVFNLFQSLENKIIIMTSHDEDIYLQCQRIYRIADKKAVLEKEEKIDEFLALNKQIKENNIPLKLLNRYVFSKYDRQKMYSVLYSFITAIVVSLCAFLTFFTINSLHEQNVILDRLSQNQIYVINQTTPALGNNSYSYYYDNIVFKDDIEQELSSIEGITSIYPYYWISMTDTQLENYEEINFVLSYSDKEDKMVKVSAAPYDFSLIPYTKEQNFERKMQIINPENKEFGVYVNHIFLLMTGLKEEDLVGATIKTTVYPPVGYTIAECLLIQEETEEIDLITHQPVGLPIEVELPVLGFVDFWYNDDWGNSFIYCPIDYMESLRAAVMDCYHPCENEFIWNQNAYMVFVDDLENIEEVNIKIRAIDENIATGNKYMDNTAMYEQKRYVEITSSVAVVVVLLAGTILSYVYGIYYYQKQQNDLLYMKRNALVRKEFNQLLVLDCLYQIVINVLFAIPIVFFVSYFGQIYLNMLKFDVISTEAIIIFALLVVLTIIQTLISRIHYYKKGINR